MAKGHAYYAANREQILAKRKPMPPKPCRRCGRTALSARHWYCGPCRALALEKRRIHSAGKVNTRTTKERGYGSEHQRLRKIWDRRIQAGEMPICGYRHCDQPVFPGQPWHLGHPDDDKSRTPTPWHKSCNLKFAAAVTQRRRNRQKRMAA